MILKYEYSDFINDSGETVEFGSCHSDELLEEDY